MTTFRLTYNVQSLRDPKVAAEDSLYEVLSMLAGLDVEVTLSNVKTFGRHGTTATVAVQFKADRMEGQAVRTTVEHVLSRYSHDAVRLAVREGRQWEQVAA